MLCIRLGGQTHNGSYKEECFSLGLLSSEVPLPLPSLNSHSSVLSEKSTFSKAVDCQELCCLKGEENGTPLQYSCLENSMGGGASQATVPGIAKTWTQLRDCHSLTWCLYPQGQQWGKQTNTKTQTVRTVSWVYLVSIEDYSLGGSLSESSEEVKGEVSMCVILAEGLCVIKHTSQKVAAIHGEQIS